MFTRLAAPYSSGTVTRHLFGLQIFQHKKVPGSSPTKAVYNPKAFILHAASLHQAFAHCGRFSTAASRRSMDRVAVPLLGIMLSHPLPVIALVSHSLTNKLIGRRRLRKRLPCGNLYSYENYQELAPLSRSYA